MLNLQLLEFMREERMDVVIQAGSKKIDADQTILKRRKFINVLNLWQTFCSEK